MTQSQASLNDLHDSLRAVEAQVVTLTERVDADLAARSAAQEALAAAQAKVTELQGVVSADNTEAQAMLAEVASLHDAVQGNLDKIGPVV